MKKLKNQKPSIRFKEFSYNWPQVRMGDILKIGSGKDYKHLNPGDIPVFGSGGYMTSVDEAIYSGETVFIGRKGSIDKPFYYNGAFWTVDTLFYTRDFKKCVPKFVYCLFQNINWYKYNAASGVPSLSKKTIESIIIDIPSLPEQQKIASFLSKVDEKITLLTKKKELLEEYKKGVTQKIFKQEIRFKIPNEAGELVEPPKWEKRKLGEIAERVTRKNKVDNQNVLTISAQHGLISQLEYFNKSVSAKNLKNYFLLKRNEFAYNKSYSKGYPMGAIKRLSKYDEGVVSTLYICFRFKDSVSLQYMEQYFESGLQNREIEKVAQEGARNHGLLNIGLSDFFEIDIRVPVKSEQIKIANFLSSIDKKITTIDQQLSLAKEWKKGLLQKMFV